MAVVDLVVVVVVVVVGAGASNCRPETAAVETLVAAVLAYS